MSSPTTLASNSSTKTEAKPDPQIDPKVEADLDEKFLARISREPVAIDSILGKHPNPDSPEWKRYKRLSRAGRIARWTNNGVMKIMDADAARKVRPQI